MNDAVLAMVLVVLAVVGLLVLIRSVKIVPMGQTGVVERLGRFHRAIEPGLHMVAPFVDRVQLTVASGQPEVSLLPVDCVTIDGQRVSVEAVVCYRLANPAYTSYLSGVTPIVQAQVAMGLRLLLADRTLEQAQSSIFDLGHRLQVALVNFAAGDEVTVHEVEIRRIAPAGS